MDLKNFAPSADTLEVTLRHPGNGEPLLNEGKDEEMTITVALPHSKAYKKVLYGITDKNLKTAQANPDKVKTSQYLADVSLELVSGITLSWDITLDGKCPKLTQSKAKEIYEEYPWIKTQVEKAVEAQVNFTLAS